MCILIADGTICADDVPTTTSINYIVFVRACSDQRRGAEEEGILR